MNVVLKENVLDDTLGIFEYLDAINIEYRKQYKGMYGRQMTVPRGQASFTISDDIHYNYKVAGGSPPNQVIRLNRLILSFVPFLVGESQQQRLTPRDPAYNIRHPAYV